MNNGAHPIHISEIPTAVTAVSEYRHQGSSITDPSEFGEDPLEDNDVLLRCREQLRLTRCGAPISVIYTELMAGNSQSLQDAIVKFIETTQEQVHKKSC